MCPRSLGKLWLNYYVVLPVASTCRVDGVQACTARADRRFASFCCRHGPAIDTSDTVHLRGAYHVSALAAKVRVPRRVAVAPSGNRALPPAATTAEPLGARAKPFPHRGSSAAESQGCPLALGAQPGAGAAPWPAPSLVMREDCPIPISVMIDGNQVYDVSQ